MQYSRWGPTGAEYSRKITSFDQLAVLHLMQPTKFPFNSFSSRQIHGTRTLHLVGLKGSLLELYLTCGIVWQWEKLTFRESGCSQHRTIQGPKTSQVHRSSSAYRNCQHTNVLSVFLLTKLMTPTSPSPTVHWLANSNLLLSFPNWKSLLHT